MIVAGVSIFNIMMMSVTERIKEIGIMRSIGTQRKEVMSMFIYEAAILGVVGSIIGGFMSLLAGYAISSLMLKTTKYLFVTVKCMILLLKVWHLGSSSALSVVSTRHGGRQTSTRSTHSGTSDRSSFPFLASGEPFFQVRAYTGV